MVNKGTNEIKIQTSKEAQQVQRGFGLFDGSEF